MAHRASTGGSPPHPGAQCACNPIQVEEVPEAIGHFPRMRKLDLGHNHLTVLPESLGALRELDVLYIHDNRLTHLPEALGTRLPRLRHIDLRANPLQSLPPRIAAMPSLEKLDLRWTGLAPPPGLRERGCEVLA